jgi:amino-acid N-acetyltransferase
MSDQFIQNLRQISPYLKSHQGKTFVLHLDAELWKSEDFISICHEIALLNVLNVKLVIVMGSPQSTPRPIDFLQMQSYNAALAKQSDQLISHLSSGLSDAAGSGGQTHVVSGNVVKARPVGIIRGVDFGFAGKVSRIDIAKLEQWIDHAGSGAIAVLPSKGYSVSGEIYGLQSQSLACQVAKELGAEKLIFLLSEISLEATIFAASKKWMSFTQLLNSEKQNYQEVEFLTGSAASRRLQYWLVQYQSEHLKRVHLLPGEPEALLKELYTADGYGHMIAADNYDEIRQATISDIPGILALIQPMEQTGELVARPREQLEQEHHLFTLLLRDNKIIGCAALYPYGKQAELACFVISQSYQKRGLARFLLREMEQKAREQSIEELFVLSTQTGGWFIQNGFARIGRDDLPEQKKQFYNWQRQSIAYAKSISKS